MATENTCRDSSVVRHHILFLACAGYFIRSSVMCTDFSPSTCAENKFRVGRVYILCDLVYHKKKKKNGD